MRPAIRIAAAATATLALSASGCVPSLAPLYTDDDLVTDPRLAGRWFRPEAAEGDWTFEAGEGKSYRLTIRGEEDGKPTEGIFVAHLLSLHGHRFLDLLPDPSSLQTTGLGVFYKMTLVPAHLIFRVDEVGDGLQLAPLDRDWIEKLLESDSIAIDHRIIGDDGIVLTASTRELQQFVLEHVDTPGAFGEAQRFVRQPAG